PLATAQNDTTTPDPPPPAEAMSGPERFAAFMRFLAPPLPSKTMPGGATSIANGKNLFMKIGCAYCHTSTLYTGNTTVAALRNKPANLYSDLALHSMWPGLADDISQTAAAGGGVRTTHLWGGRRRTCFFN